MRAVVVNTGPHAGRRVEFGTRMLIGRHDADLVLEDPEVSRRHAALRCSGDSMVIEDLNSTNGTFVNGQRIRTPTTLRPSDEVRVGKTTLRIEQDRRADDTVITPPSRPDLMTFAGVGAPGRRFAERADEISTQPLPPRGPQTRARRPGSSRSWIAIAAVVLAVIVGAAAFARLPTPTGFTADANRACDTLRRSGHAVDLSGNRTRGDLERALSMRLQALGALRAAGEPEKDAALVAAFLSGFGRTNASISRLASAIADARGDAAAARQGLRQDVRSERSLAERAGIAACGGLAFVEHP